MKNNSEFKKYKVSYGERCDGPQCNGDYEMFVESKILPDWWLLRLNGFLLGIGNCNNITYPGCENAGPSYLVNFKAEELTQQQTKDTGLEKFVRLDKY